jgi:hypothetical protein
MDGKVHMYMNRAALCCSMCASGMDTVAEGSNQTCLSAASLSLECVAKIKDTGHVHVNSQITWL